MQATVLKPDLADRRWELRRERFDYVANESGQHVSRQHLPHQHECSALAQINVQFFLRGLEREISVPMPDALPFAKFSHEPTERPVERHQAVPAVIAAEQPIEPDVENLGRRSEDGGA